MATVTLTLTDCERGMLIKLSSDPGLPEYEDDETLAQTLGILALEIIKKEFREVTGREPVPVVSH